MILGETNSNKYDAEFRSGMDLEELERYRQVQDIAKETMAFLGTQIASGMSEANIARLAEKHMYDLGVNSFWYYGVGALVLVGGRTGISVSGRDCRPSTVTVGDTDLVTVDLSPQVNGRWGDYARSFLVSEGKVCSFFTPLLGDQARVLALYLRAEEQLHAELASIVRPGVHFSDTFTICNGRIREMGFQNLDFKNNLGHTIEKDIDERRYIESGSSHVPSELELFTFEPHIGLEGVPYGAKHENIYYLQNGSLQML
jgi:Xaa-Pro aminopeptidase